MTTDYAAAIDKWRTVAMAAELVNAEIRRDLTVSRARVAELERGARLVLREWGASDGYDPRYPTARAAVDAAIEALRPIIPPASTTPARVTTDEHANGRSGKAMNGKGHP